MVLATLPMMFSLGGNLRYQREPATKQITDTTIRAAGRPKAAGKQVYWPRQEEAAMIRLYRVREDSKKAAGVAGVTSEERSDEGGDDGAGVDGEVEDGEELLQQVFLNLSPFPTLRGSARSSHISLLELVPAESRDAGLDSARSQSDDQ